VTGLLTIQRQGYPAAGLWALARDVLLADLVRGLLAGIASAALLWLLGKAVGRVATRLLGWRAPIPSAPLATAWWVGGGWLLGMGYVLNVFLVPYQLSPRGVAANALLLASAPLAAALAGWIHHRREGRLALLGPWDRACRVGTALLLALLAGGLGHRFFADREPEARAPDILLVTVDTLRPDHLGCYGYTRETSPNVDRLAAEGRLFLEAYAHAPITNSSVASLLSGMLPRETGTYAITPLAPEVTTVAEILRDAGYRTAAVVSNYVLRRGMGFEAGFDHYDDRMEERELVRRIPERVAEKTTAAALAWLREHREEPFFLWIHYQDPHGPYAPPGEHADAFLDQPVRGPRLPFRATNDGEGGIPYYQRLDREHRAGFYVARYDAEIRYFDRAFGRLLSGLDSLALPRNLVILFTSDHGEGMGEHGYFFAHGDHLYRSQIRVPLILWDRGRLVPEGVRDSTLVAHLDVAPTILRLAGLPPPAGMQGVALLGAIPRDRSVFSEAVVGRTYKCSLVSDGLLLVYEWLNDAYQAYDLATGAVLEGLFGERQRLARMRETLRLLANPKALARGLRHRRRGLSPQERERLESLGYIR
jgi:arylsulfatase